MTDEPAKRGPGRPRKTTTGESQITTEIETNELNNMFNQAEVEPEPLVEQAEPDKKNDKSKPELYDENWSDYVLSLFNEKELFQDKPKVEGLRRLARLLLGKIVQSYPKEVVVTPSSTTVSYVVVFINGTTYGGVADVSSYNTSPPYDKYPSSVAETRAEGRALRKALGLNVITAEEAMGGSMISPEVAPISPMEDVPTTAQGGQLIVIRQMCKKLDINQASLIATLSPNESPEVLSYENAITAIGKLNGWQNAVEEIPLELKGFAQEKVEN